MSTLKDSVTKWLTQKAIENFLRKVKGDKEAMSFINGYKTYIIAALIILNAGVQMVGIDVPHFSGPSEALMYAAGLFFARNGAKKDVKKLAE